MADDNNKAGEKSAKTGTNKLLIVLIVLVLILGVAAAAVYFFTLKKTPAVENMAPNQGIGAQQGAQRSTTTEPGPMQVYPPFLVNLADPSGNRYLRTTLSLELSKDKNFQAEVIAKEPKIKDIIISVLSSKTYDEINTAQGKIALKQEILRRLNMIMNGGRINDIYITEFVVQ